MNRAVLFGKRGLVCLCRLATMVFLMSVLLMGLWSHSTYAEEVRGVTDHTIKFGIIGDMTGPAVATWFPMIEGVRNHFRHVNDQGGIHGRKVKVIAEDSRISIARALAAFKKLAYRDRVIAFWGPGSTSEIFALFSQIEKEKMPDMSPSPSEGLLKPFKRYVFLLAALYDEQVGVMMDYIKNDLEAKDPRIAVVYTDNESGKTVLRSVRKYTKLYGLNLVSEQVLNFGAVDATSQVLNLKRAKADYIIQLAIIQVAACLLRDARKYSLDATFFATMYGCDEDTVKLAGKASKKFIGAHCFSPWYEESPGVVKMRDVSLKYQPGKTHNRYYTQGWVAAMLFTDAMKRAGKDLTSEKLVDRLEEIKDFDTKGLCGPITFTSKNHKALDSVKLYKADVEKALLIPVTGWRRPSR